jgi:S1-C subfamily serine protease
MRLIYTAFLLCTYACASETAVPDFVSTIASVKGAVIPVVCVGQNPNGTTFLISVEGTGFFVSDDGDFVTAGHVAQGMFAKERIPACPLPAVYVPVNGWNADASVLTWRVTFIDRCWWEESDIAVCKLKENPFTASAVKVKPRTVDLDVSVQRDGTPVAFTGFPLSFLQPITSQGIVGVYQAPEAPYGPKVLVVDKNAWPGASGSPVYTSNGKIIGVIVQRGLSDATASTTRAKTLE